MKENTKREERKKVVILGAGITGLKAGAELAKRGYEVLILEKNNKIGGMAYSFQHKGFILDYGPHKFYSQIKGIMPEYKEIIGEDCLVREKTNSLYLLGKYFVFPPKPMQLLFGISPFLIAQCGIDYAIAVGKNFVQRKKNITYEDYFLNGFGKKGYEILFRDFCWKVWGDPQQISEELARRRIPIPNIKELIKNTITGMKEKPEVSAKYFYYPKNGFGELADILANTIQKYSGKILLSTEPVKIQTKGKKIEIIEYKNKDGEKENIQNPDVLISTIHLNDFISIFEPDAEEEVKRAATKLRYRGLRLCYIILEKEKAIKQNWFFFPEKNVCFNRVSEQKSFSPYTAPENKTVITAEITCDEGSFFYEKEDQEIKEKVIENLEKVGILKKDEVKEFFSKKMKRVYPIYAVGFREYLKEVLEYIHSHEACYTIGRQGLFNYNNTDHCMDMANILVEHIANGSSKEELQEILNIFDNYKIVD